MKYADYLLEGLKREGGYTHCYFVAGGNIMHLLDAARTRFKCIPVVSEVAAGIAAEYFNESNKEGKKAFVLVTAGPGLTNAVTSIAGAFLESRELLVIGGQVKTADLKSPNLRQRGIQEIDGVSIVRSITSKATTLHEPLYYEELFDYLRQEGRPGPIFLEIPLDVQGVDVKEDLLFSTSNLDIENDLPPTSEDIKEIQACLMKSERPIILLGGGISRKAAATWSSKLSETGIPIMTTWNGADRYGADLPNYWGRPNTWGQRSANALIQQADCLIAIGTRLGLQQTGFAWQEFAPLAEIFQVDIDHSELAKGHPRITRGICCDAEKFLEKFIGVDFPSKNNFAEWREFGQRVIEHFPLNDKLNSTSSDYVNPYQFVEKLSEKLVASDVFIPCSSGGAFTVSMQSFVPKFGQIIVTDKGLASMGYGLSGAIGACEATKRRTVLIEGDGGFAQNLQELGTVARQNLNLKIFVFSNEGYASIRMTQKNYFDGAYLGCDIETGLGLPNWELIAKAFGINFSVIKSVADCDQILDQALSSGQPEFIEVKIDPEQTYFPKITSRIDKNGNMVSKPLHLMTPDLTDEEIDQFLPYLKDRI